MNLETLKELYVNELRDLYNAENQLIKALPKMAKAASSDELKEAFEKHLEQTKGQVQRLEEVFEEIDEKPKVQDLPRNERIDRRGIGTHRLNVGVDHGANLDAPNSLSGRSAAERLSRNARI